MVAANHEEHTHKVSNTKNVLVGLLIGGLAGAAAMLLFAPQSGKRARTQIQARTSQLRERTTELVDKGLAQVRLDTRAIAAGVLEQAWQVRQIG